MDQKLVKNIWSRLYQISWVKIISGMKKKEFKLPEMYNLTLLCKKNVLNFQITNQRYTNAL